MFCGQKFLAVCIHLQYVRAIALFSVKFCTAHITLKRGQVRSTKTYLLNRSNRCKQTPADLIHMLWLCPSLCNCWTDIFKTISEIVEERIEPNTLTAQFGVSSFVPSLSKYNRDVIAFVTLLARRIILTKWKLRTPPSHVHWLADVLYFLQLEKKQTYYKEFSSKVLETMGPIFSVF